MTAFWNIYTSVIALLPASGAKNWLLSRRRSYRIAADARVGICLVRNVETLTVGSGASIGFGNVLRNLRSVTIGERVVIGHLNWFSASPMFLVSQSPGIPPSVGTLIVGKDSIIVSRHHFDCSGGLDVGEWAIFGGHGSEVLTHSLTIREAAQVAAPVRIGRYAFIGSRVLILNDVDIADYAIVAAGAVVPRSLEKEYGFYAGVPATWKTEVSPTITLFHRKPGLLSVRDF